MKKSELVVELGMEEIPASMIADAAEQFAGLLGRALEEHRLPAGERTLWYTPRRIILGLEDVPVRQGDLEETIMGPPRRVAYDAAGNPTRAALAFAEKNGVPLAKIGVVATPKGEYLSLVRRMRGEPAVRILQRLIPDAIGAIQFPKTMHWSPDRFRFARPVRWIVALFGGRVVKFRLADVVSSRITSGHRFLGRSRIAVHSLASLREELERSAVLVDPAERRERIESELAARAAEAGGRLLEDRALLETVVNLNEAPSVVRGDFEERFLSLPQEILITVMREHQKYFSVLDAEGRLLPCFLAVVNRFSDPGGEIRSGHERVLRARLADAAFFWETDRRQTLEERAPSLKNVLFQEKLGSYDEKTRRVLELLPRLAEALGRGECLADLRAAARIYKCDLVTEMVKEFTDLQGIVGGLYARAEGYPETVWRAVYEQYLPKSTASPSPSTVTGAILALADRLDTVTGCFSIGLVPSGSGDPFAVRRQGNGILKILFDHRLSLSLGQAIGWSLAAHGRGAGDTAAELGRFFEGRLRFLFEEMGFAYDCVNAVLAAGWDDPLDALDRLRALEEMRRETDFLSLASNFKRVANILAKAGDEAGEPDSPAEPEESLLAEGAERDLYRSLLGIRPEADEARRRHDYVRALRLFASMRAAVDAFFTDVMVMTEDRAIRRNRIALLASISRLFNSVADISRIVVEKGT
ncbi:MAG: glycine--tRNA ligase subunit beta [Acidobacteriota bacterium]|jgi:glycyl-tRNA synthetase beta chain|nr:glycine--tRNA ligase subunit beta [Acidobacteriota bacterium]